MKTLATRLISFMAIGLSILFAGRDKLIRVEEARVSMGCTYVIVAYTNQPEKTSTLLGQALDEVDRIDALMSHYKKESALSRINREAALRAVVIDSELFDFIERCLNYSRVSDGAFDITVGRLMKVWGFFEGTPRVPSAEALADAVAQTGYKHVILNKMERSIRFARPGIELDPGGIGKGYAVDRAVAILKSQGITRALVNAGGSTLFAIGTPPGESGWEVKIEGHTPVRLRERALSVSGAYSKSFESNGIRYGHILDPRTGWPITGIEKVIVIAGSGTEADALDNLLYVIGPEASREFLKQRGGAEAYFITRS
jgi:thiamine biosynthesis lipoprotein